MTKRYSGGCACGAIRYATGSKPIFENHCQCHDCQKRSGTGHGSYLTFAQRAEVTIVGEANTWRLAGDSGNTKVHAFCPDLWNAGLPDIRGHAAADSGQRDQP